MRITKTKIKCFFGFHNWKKISSANYHILDSNNDAIGSITLDLFKCTNCPEQTLIPSDKKIFKN
jgi:hypothetical protein